MMEPASDSHAAEYGGMPTDRTILLASDTHPENVADGFRNSLRYNVMRKDWEAIAEDYGCEELWLGGDIGNAEDFKAYLGYDFETLKAVVGDEDRKVDLGDGTPGWYAREVEEYGSLEQIDGMYGVETGETVSAAIPADEPYTVTMGHDPELFGIDYHSQGEVAPEFFEHDLNEPQVVLYGHKHRPFARTVQNSLAIGMGSTYRNYEVNCNLPERSIHVLDINDTTLDVHHLDLDPDSDARYEPFEHQRFVLHDGRFREVQVMDAAPRPMKHRFENLPEVARSEQ